MIELIAGLLIIKIWIINLIIGIWINWMLIDVKYFLIMTYFVNNLKNMVEKYPMCHLEFNVGLNLVI